VALYVFTALALQLTIVGLAPDFKARAYSTNGFWRKKKCFNKKKYISEYLDIYPIIRLRKEAFQD
jgi:hypothetical protein